jgi:hypothetical protein
MLMLSLHLHYYCRSIFDAVRSLLPPPEVRRQPPDESLRRGEWFKLICGASFEDLADVRNLALVFTLAGADCVDCAADAAVIAAAREVRDDAAASSHLCIIRSLSCTVMFTCSHLLRGFTLTFS